MLDLLGRRADGWIAPLSTGFETKAAAQDRIDAAARTAGREPSEIRRVIQLVGSVTDVAQTTTRPRSGPGNRPFCATPELWAEIITELVVDERFNTVELVPEDGSPQQLVRFGTQVIPATRSTVSASTRASLKRLTSARRKGVGAAPASWTAHPLPKAVSCHRALRFAP